MDFSDYQKDVSVHWYLVLSFLTFYAIAGQLTFPYFCFRILSIEKCFNRCYYYQLITSLNLNINN